MTVSRGAGYNSGDDRGNDADIVISGVTTPASGTVGIVVMVHQHQGTATVTGVTFGATGATFTELITEQGANGRRDTILFSKDAPLNTTADITVTMSANNRPKGADAYIVTSDTGDIAGVGKSGFGAANTAITGSVNPLGSGHQLFACCTYGSGGGSVAPTSGTELWDLDASGPGPDSDYWSAALATTGTGSHTISGTISGTSGWHMVIAEITDDPPPPNFDTVANGAKAYTNGSVSDAVVIAGGSSGTPASMREGGTYQIRHGVQNNSGSAKNFNPQLQYNHNSGGWVDCDEASTVAKVVRSENVLNGTATTQRSTSGTFTAGSFEDVDGLINAYSVPNGNFTEVVYTVYIDPAQVAASDTLEFRVNDLASAPPSGTNHLYCSITAAALPGIVAHAEATVSVENACSRWFWAAANGDLYVLREGGVNQNIDASKAPAILSKSTDSGLTWRTVDVTAFYPPNGNGDLEGTDVLQLATTGEWMLLHIETGDDVHADIFRTSDHGSNPDTWATPLANGNVQDGADSGNATMTHVTGAARQNTEVLAVYPNNGGTRDVLHWNLRNTSGVWDASPGAVFENTGTDEFTGPVMSQGLSSRSLLCYLDTTNNVLYFRWASSADPPAWSSRVQVNTNGTTVANGINGPIMVFDRYDDTNDYHVVAWLDNSDNLWVNTIKWNGSGYDIGSTPVQVNTVSVESNWPGATETVDLDNQGVNGGGAADPSTGTLHMLYADSTNRSLYYQTWTEGGGAGTETLEFDPSGSEGVGFVQVIVHDSKVKYVYELVVGNADPAGRGLFYNEIVLSTAQTLAWQSGTATASAGSWSPVGAGAATLAWSSATATASAGSWTPVASGAATLAWSSATATGSAGSWTPVVSGAAPVTWSSATASASAGSWTPVGSGAATLVWSSGTATASAGTWSPIGAGAATLSWSSGTATASAGTWSLVPSGAATLAWSSGTATATAGTWTPVLAGGPQAVPWSSATATASAGSWTPVGSGAATLTWSSGTATATAGSWTPVISGAVTVTWSSGTATASAGSWTVIASGAATLTWSSGTATATTGTWSLVPSGAVAAVWSSGTATASAASWSPVVAGAATLSWSSGTATALAGTWAPVPSGAVALVWSSGTATASAGSWTPVLVSAQQAVWSSGTATASAGTWTVVASGAATVAWSSATATASAGTWVVVGAGAVALSWSTGTASASAGTWTLVPAGAATLSWSTATATASASSWQVILTTIVWSSATAVASAGSWALRQFIITGFSARDLGTTADDGVLGGVGIHNDPNETSRATALGQTSRVHSPGRTT